MLSTTGFLTCENTAKDCCNTGFPICELSNFSI